MEWRCITLPNVSEAELEDDVTGQDWLRSLQAATWLAVPVSAPVPTGTPSTDVAATWWPRALAAKLVCQITPEERSMFVLRAH